MSDLHAMTTEELEDEIRRLKGEIGKPCNDPECPHCPRYWAAVSELDLLRDRAEPRP